MRQTNFEVIKRAQDISLSFFFCIFSSFFQFNLAVLSVFVVECTRAIASLLPAAFSVRALGGCLIFGLVCWPIENGLNILI